MKLLNYSQYTKAEPFKSYFSYMREFRYLSGIWSLYPIRFCRHTNVVICASFIFFINNALFTLFIIQIYVVHIYDTNIYKHKYIYTYVYKCICIYVHTYINMYMHTCIHTYIHMHTYVYAIHCKYVYIHRLV